jgi:tetratricopeptide (TPR) repeat protein
MVPACPNPEVLRQFLEGQLAAAAEREVDGHIARCPECEAKLQSLMPGATPWDNAPPMPCHVGHYEIRAEIARGGMGCVYAAHDRNLDREVAIKTLLPGSSRERFVNESKVTARLPHPGIPPVHDLGRLDDGSPFLVMKRVHGRTLAEMLADRGDTNQDLSQFLQIFEQIAQAVGFAHANRINHRDLKPLNVMVGAFGEVQVMDWGLAKDLSRHDAETPSDGLPDGRLHATRAGSIIGTPGYMAPEQARGEPIDERGDVFALGAILAAILTGKPAFVGTTARETIELAAKADLAEVLIRLESCGADDELIVLTKRCLSAARDDRPANAEAVANDVAAYRAGVEARLRQAETERAEAVVRESEQRRRKRVVQWAGGLIAGALLAGVIGTAIGIRNAWKQESIALDESKAKGIALREEEYQRGLAEANAKAAIAARDEESRQRAKSEKAYSRTSDVLDAMVSGVTGKSLETQKVITPEQKKFLEEVLTYYREFAAVKGDDEQTRARTAWAAIKVGNIEYRLGRMKQSAESYSRALREYDALAKEYPLNLKHRANLAKSQSDFGATLVELGKQKEAEIEYRKSLEILLDISNQYPMNLEYEELLGRSHVSLGLLLANLGDWKSARQHYAEGLLIQQKHSSQHPDNQIYQSLCQKSYLNLGNLGGKEAGEYYKKSLSISENLVDKHPDIPEYRHSLSGIHLVYASHFAELEQHIDAEKHYTIAAHNSSKLSADFPMVPMYRNMQAIISNNFGALLVANKRYQEAEEKIVFAMKIREQLSRDFPLIVEYRINLSDSFLSLGVVRADLGRRKEAESEYMKAREIQLELTRQFPKVPEYQANLGCTECNLGNLASEDGEYEMAVSRYDKAIELLSPLHLQNPLEENSKQFLLRSYWGRARVYARIGKHSEALMDWNRSMELCPKSQLSHFIADRAYTKLKLGLVVEAVKDISVLRKRLGWSDEQLINFACIYSLASVKIIDKRTEYAEEAVELARKAIKAGYKNYILLKNSNDFAPLRDRDDFRKLIAELEAKFPAAKK